MAFRRSTSQGEVPKCDPITARMCGDFCHRMLQSFNDDEPELIRTVRSACLNSTGGFPSLIEVAARINVSPRTLHRRLAESGLGYQAILDDVRRRLAEEYLRNTALSIDEIAARTGFSEASNFRKAFKKWTRNYRRITVVASRPGRTSLRLRSVRLVRDLV